MTTLQRLPRHDGPAEVLEQAPAQQPLTSAALGAFGFGVTATLVAWSGVAPAGTAALGFVAVVTGLVLAVPTVAIGFLDYLAAAPGTARRRAAATHWLTMLTAVSLFVAAAALLEDAFATGHVSAVGAAVAVGAQVLLLAGVRLSPPPAAAAPPS